MLRPYQTRAVNEVATKLAEGKRKVIFQMSTGGGKTISFSAISSRYTAKSNKSVLIIVHRQELLKQTRKTLFDKFGIIAQVIIAGMRTVPPAKVYVAMVESLVRRLPQIKDIGLVIIDEAHIASFNKMHEHFPDQFIIGFTATPLSSNKRIPIKSFYDDIVCAVDIPELIAQGSLCQNITYAPKDVVDRAALTVKNGEFDDARMAVEFSKPRYIKNTVEAYEKWTRGTKAIVFNVNVAHSKDVNDAFILAGYNSKHLDGTMSDTERRHILQWYATTPDAILNNVGIATTGFDEPTIETVIMNKSTLSMPLWLQCTGRGSRPTDAKSMFTIIDMGGNAMAHGDWSDERNWRDLFENPPKPGKGGGVSPVKNCPQCDAIVPASAKVCKFCEQRFPDIVRPEEKLINDFVIITKGINVRAVIEQHRDKKQYYSFFRMAKDIAAQATKIWPGMTDEIATSVLSQYHEKAKEWCHANNKKFNQWHQEKAKETLFTELALKYPKWLNPLIIT